MQTVRRLGTILGIWAHPDDEAYLAGGVMAAAAEAGQRVGCVTATAGEHGTDDPSRWPPARLGRVRRRELAAALRVLGVHEHTWLDYPDGGCSDAPTGEAVARLVDIIERYRPDTILTFGPDGITGHPDHMAVGRWARLAAEAAALREQATQTTPLIEAFGADRWREWIRSEAFRPIDAEAPTSATSPPQADKG